VTTVSPSLRDGLLSFYHAPASVFVVVRKKGTEPAPDPGFTFADVAGVYRGAVVPIDPARQPGALSTADFVLMLTDIGTFLPAWTKPGSETSVYPYTYYRGNYAIDVNALLLLAAGIGGNDYGLATPMPFFDWALDGATLHMTSFDSHGTAHLAVSLDGSAPNLNPPPQLADLVRGSFRGSAFRVTPQNTIEEFEGVTARFDPDGSLHTNWRDRLADIDPPTDTAAYRLVSPRHLLLGFTYEGAPGIVAEATTDYCLTGDTLCFTSFAREAYFVFNRD
jgi:hypothetical protein